MIFGYLVNQKKGIKEIVITTLTNKTNGNDWEEWEHLANHGGRLSIRKRDDGKKEIYCMLDGIVIEVLPN